MKAVTLELDIDKLQVLNKVWACKIMPSRIATKEERVINDVARSLSKKLQKKAIDKEFETKDFSISFSYSEGYYLEKIFINKKNEVSESIYEDTVFQNTINNINQQLA